MWPLSHRVLWFARSGSIYGLNCTCWLSIVGYTHTSVIFHSNWWLSFRELCVNVDEYATLQCEQNVWIWSGFGSKSNRSFLENFIENHQNRQTRMKRKPPLWRQWLDHEAPPKGANPALGQFPCCLNSYMDPYPGPDLDPCTTYLQNCIKIRVLLFCDILLTTSQTQVKNISTTVEVITSDRWFLQK